jgi:hypothetical protein
MRCAQCIARCARKERIQQVQERVRGQGGGFERNRGLHRIVEQQHIRFCSNHAHAIAACCSLSISAATMRIALCPARLPG